MLKIIISPKEFSERWRKERGKGTYKNGEEGYGFRKIEKTLYIEGEKVDVIIMEKDSKKMSAL